MWETIIVDILRLVTPQSPSDDQSIIVYILLFERLNVDDYELFVRQFAQFT